MVGQRVSMMNATAEFHDIFKQQWLFADIIVDNPQVFDDEPLHPKQDERVTTRCAEIILAKGWGVNMDKNSANIAAQHLRNDCAFFLPRRGHVVSYDRDMGNTIQNKCASIRSRPEDYAHLLHFSKVCCLTGPHPAPCTPRPPHSKPPSTLETTLESLEHSKRPWKQPSTLLISACSSCRRT